MRRARRFLFVLSLTRAIIGEFSLLWAVEFPAVNLLNPFSKTAVPYFSIVVFFWGGIIFYVLPGVRLFRLKSRNRRLPPARYFSIFGIKRLFIRNRGRKVGKISRCIFYATQRAASLKIARGTQKNFWNKKKKALHLNK